MPRLAIDKDFLGDFSKLEKSVQSLVMAAFDKFEGHTYAGHEATAPNAVRGWLAALAA